MMNHVIAAGRCTFVLVGAVLLAGICLIHATTRYYGTYVSFGTGDTMIYTLRTHLGPQISERKWHAECLDGEAVVGVINWVNDYQNIDAIWCKYIFAYKPPTQGMYPFYPKKYYSNSNNQAPTMKEKCMSEPIYRASGGCHVRNYTNQWYCFDPKNIKLTVDTFITGFWDNEQNFFMSRPGIDNINPIKCCKPPPGYYIDYTSCYYQPTHDQYWEFYDSLTHNLVVCASGFVVTGLAKKFGPIVRVNDNPTEWHIDWLQCCRVGYSGQRTIDPARRLPSNTTLPPKPFSFG